MAKKPARCASRWQHRANAAVPCGSIRRWTAVGFALENLTPSARFACVNRRPHRCVGRASMGPGRRSGRFAQGDRKPSGVVRGTLTEKLLTYALGRARRLSRYAGGARNRRDAASNGYKFFRL